MVVEIHFISCLFPSTFYSVDPFQISHSKSFDLFLVCFCSSNMDPTSSSSSEASSPLKTPTKPVPSKHFEELQNAPKAPRRQLFPRHRIGRPQLNFSAPPSVKTSRSHEAGTATPTRKRACISPEMIRKLILAVPAQSKASFSKIHTSACSSPSERRLSLPLSWAPKKKSILRRSLQLSKA